MTDQPLPEFNAFQTVIDEIPDPIWVVDDDLRFVYVNSFLLERSDRSRAEWIGSPLEDLWESELNRIENGDALLETLEEILTGELSQGRTEVVLETDSGSITRSVKSVPWTVGERITGVLNIARDITDRRTRERQLKILDRILRHNVRNEMSVVTGNAQIIEQVGNDEAKEYAANIRSTARRLLDTVGKERDIVDVIRKDLKRSRIDLVEVVERRVESVRSTAAEVTVETDLPDSAEVEALSQIERAIEELLGNAVEHSDREVPSLWIDIEQEADSYRLTISDDGPTIPDEEVGVLTAAEVQPLYHGSGLGLWLVNWVVEESGGRLSFETNEPRGNTVILDLPKAD
ncbi:PAS domain-containing sensor histidine kinase [Halodesulfurarchaeum sp.]|uniref:PAS domain-containing sensor histidine kinase n=1 Tax=Halodesulfurarchaeum sp. TaxID=1980530 RepID=UPI002FC2AE5A